MKIVKFVAIVVINIALLAYFVNTINGYFTRNDEPTETIREYVVEHRDDYDERIKEWDRKRFEENRAKYLAMAERYKEEHGFATSEEAIAYLSSLVE